MNPGAGDPGGRIVGPPGSRNGNPWKKSILHWRIQSFIVDVYIDYKNYSE